MDETNEEYNCDISECCDRNELYEIVDENEENIIIQIIFENHFIWNVAHLYDSKHRYFVLQIPDVNFNINNLQYQSFKISNNPTIIYQHNYGVLCIKECVSGNDKYYINRHKYFPVFTFQQPILK